MGDTYLFISSYVQLLVSSIDFSRSLGRRSTLRYFSSSNPSKAR